MHFDSLNRWWERAELNATRALLGVTDLSVMRSDIFEASTEAADSLHDERPAQIVLQSSALITYTTHTMGLYWWSGTCCSIERMIIFKIMDQILLLLNQ